MNEVAGFWTSDNTTMCEVAKRDGTIEFERLPDGSFYVAVVAVDGYYKEDFRMNAEQFAAFKKWIMEN